MCKGVNFLIIFVFYCLTVLLISVIWASKVEDICHIEDNRLPASLTLNDMRYMIILKKADFFTALSYCRLIGMDLLWFRNENEIKQLFSSVDKEVIGSLKYWSSASDLAWKGRWHWFGSGAPVIGIRISGSGCVTVTANTSLSGEECSADHYFICNGFKSSEDIKTTICT